MNEPAGDAVRPEGRKPWELEKEGGAGERGHGGLQVTPRGVGHATERAFDFSFHEKPGIGSEQGRVWMQICVSCNTLAAIHSCGQECITGGTDLGICIFLKTADPRLVAFCDNRM